MIITADSHLDHGLTPEQVEYIRTTFLERSSFFIETITLPAELGTVPCALRGPALGEPPVPESLCVWVQRGSRAWASRTIPNPPARSRLVTVVAGPHGDQPCVLYTAYGGPQAPREPGDPALLDDVDARAASDEFWAVHALATG